MGCEASFSKLTMDNGQLTMVDAGFARAEFFQLGECLLCEGFRKLNDGLIGDGLMVCGCLD